MKFWKMKLTCITPVHIGIGVSYNPSQYIYIPSESGNGGRVYFLNESKWSNYLYEKQFIDLFAKDLLGKINQNKTFSTYEWLRSKIIELGSIDTIISDLKKCGAVCPPVPVYLDSERRNQRISLNDVHPFIRSGNEDCFIPGSSIKGAVRTALLASDIMRSPAKYRRYWQKAEQISRQVDGRNFERELAKLASEIEREFAYDKAKQEERDNKRIDISKDLFRHLQVSDAIAGKPLKMGVVQKVDLGVKASEEGAKPKTLSLFRECIMPDNVLDFSISVDDKAVKQLGASRIEDILTALQDFADLQYALQMDIYRRVELNPLRGSKNQPNEAKLLLGGGTGYLSKTILYALAVSQSNNDTKEGRNKCVGIVRKYMIGKFNTYKKKHHDAEKDRKLSPHTLKLTCYNNKTELMGLCKVEMVQEL